MAKIIGDIVRQSFIEAGVRGLTAADLHHQLKSKGLSNGTYHSLAMRFYVLRRLGLIKRAKAEPSKRPWLKDRCRYVITAKGKDKVSWLAWQNPMRSLWGEAKWKEYRRAWDKAHRSGRPRGRPRIVEKRHGSA